MSEKSEFGKGLTYCLGLFLTHAERNTDVFTKISTELGYKDDGPEMWFNGAADHLFELQVDAAPRGLRKRLENFKEKCLHWRMAMGRGDATKEDVKWAITEAKELLLEIDRAWNVPVEKASWS